MASKIHIVYGRRERDSGPWTPISKHSSKRTASKEADKQGPPYGPWSETRVIAGFDYQHPELPLLAEETQEMHEMDFTKDDLRVFKAFLDRQPLRGRRFETNGERLDGGMYLSRVATWEQDERGRAFIATHDLGSRTAQQIHRKLRKMGGGIVREGAEAIGGARAAEDRRRGPRFSRDRFPYGTRVEVIGDTVNRGRVGAVVAPDARKTHSLDNYNRQRLRDGALLIETARGELFTESPLALDFYGRPTLEASRRVDDFNTVDDLASHARREGATHIMRIDDETHIYFKRRDGKYEKAEVWQKDGYWHTQAPGSRAVVPAPPRGAQIIGVGASGRPRLVDDYIAVDRNDRTIAGPFKSYSDARGAAGTAGNVKFVPAGRRTNEASVREIHGYNIVVVLSDEHLVRKYESEIGQILDLPFIEKRTLRDGIDLVYGPIKSAAYRELEGRLYSRFGNAVRVRLEQNMYGADERGMRENGAQPWDTPVPPEARAKALDIAVDTYRELRTIKRMTPKNAYHKTWEKVQRASYGSNSQIGYFINYSFQISQIVDEAQSKVEAELTAKGRGAQPSARMKDAVTRNDDESRGEAYADEQLASDYFNEWAMSQMVEGAEMRKNDPSSVIPLESRADFQQLARRMLQDMELDTRRNTNESAEFFAGFRAKLRDKDTVDWFAEELENMQEQIGGTSVVSEQPKRRRAPKARRSAKRKRR